ncbi:helix-turn-helix domain-containing protein [Caulifigura coniformis]|uniref:helix-turn-helix domain-containing protein n=1 Tax=Caulifigura coniformis TaxID=2527983 RepID=UPI0011A1D0A5
MLRGVRVSAGVTQQELAVLLDETQSYVSKCERGERRLDLVQLQAFCRALNHPLDVFVSEYLRRSKRVSAHSTSSSRVPKTSPTRE